MSDAGRPGPAAAPARGPAGRPARLGDNRNFLRLWGAQAVSAFGSRITRTVLPIMAITLLGAGATDVAWLGTLGVIPSVLAGLLLGGHIDRTPKRPLLIATDLIRAAAVLAVPLLAWTGELHIWHLFAVAFVVGGCSSLFEMADGAFLPAVIRRNQLVAGNARLAATDSVAEVGGPAAGGILIELLTAPVALLFDALSYLWSAAWLASIRIVETPAADSAGGGVCELLRDLAIAAKGGLGHPLVGPTFVAIALMELFSGFFLTTYSLYALTELGLSAATLGLVIGAGGVGALLGAGLAGTIARRFGHGRALFGVMACGQLAAVAIPLAGWYPRYDVALLVAHQLAGDAFLVAFLVLATSLRQAVLPQAVIARTQGLLQVMTGTLMPVGAFVAAAVASTAGLPAAVWVGVLGGLLAPLPLLWQPLLALRVLPD